MEIKLADNIRFLRKERKLTQEQFAEVLGVTAGAVYKWEAKLSIPELDLIVEMADFFDRGQKGLRRNAFRVSRPRREASALPARAAR